MNKLNTILGSVALLVASNAVVKADELLAGPLPVDPRFGTGTVTCSANNAIGILKELETISLEIFDANNRTARVSVCTGIDARRSCSISFTFSPISASPLPIPASPFVCVISSERTVGGQPASVRGSICGTVSDPLAGLRGSTYCLQALIDNNSSNGWTCGSNPEACANPEVATARGR